LAGPPALAPHRKFSTLRGMSAKSGKKAARRDAARQAAAGEGHAPGGPSNSSDSHAAAAAAWIDSDQPRRRQIGRIVLAGVWVYVAALWLLALDQTFDWGVFG
jgi:hypothetical protein